MTDVEPPVDRPYNLNESLIWQLAVTGRLIRTLLDNSLPEAGPQALAVLIRLLETEGLTQAELARRQRVEAPSMSGMVDRLVRAGYVVREPHPGDRRSVCVYITDAGREIVEMSRESAEGVHDQVFADLTDDEQTMLVGLLTKVLARLPGP